MNTPQVVFLIVGGLLTSALMWFAILYELKKSLNNIKNEMHKQCNSRFIIEPKSALYRGSDKHFGNIKCNGVICLTENSLIFKKTTGQQIEIKRAEITEAKVEECFKGKFSFGTGSKHLVVKTKDGNRVGFLVRDANIWAEKAKAL